MQRGRGREDARRGAGIAALAAVVAAGGTGERAHTAVPKQFRMLGGRPLVSWSLDTLVEAGCSPVVVVVPAGEIDRAPALVGRDDVTLVAGGATRQESVLRGLEALDSEFVAIQDAARPFVTVDMIERAYGALEEADGAVIAVPLDETLKRVDGTAVDETVSREGMWRTQTPQVFRTDVLKKAHARAGSEGFVGTDDAQLVERSGGRVVVVPGSRSNIKLTYPEDFLVAEAMLEARS